MDRAIIVTEAPLKPDELLADLAAIGVSVVASHDNPDGLAQAAVKTNPDFIIAGCRTPSDGLFQAVATLTTIAPCPFIVFTSNGETATIDRATDSGIHAYVVDGYARHRLLPIISIAKSRFRREQLLRNELHGLSQRYEERRQIERAKAVLMQSRGLTEKAAFELLRGLAMSSRQRIGVVSAGIIDVSRAGDAVNRAGQLRMLSQRIVRCRFQSLLGIDPDAAAQMLTECRARIAENLERLADAVSVTGYVDHVERTRASWQALESVCAQPPDRTEIAQVDAQAEKMLLCAEALTEFLESSGLAANLHAVNIAGRQRMLSQRITKLCFQLALAPNAATMQELHDARTAFQQAMERLHSLPVTTTEIEALLQSAGTDWRTLQAALGSLQDIHSLDVIARAGDTLLAKTELLTLQYEHAMQLLISDRLGRLR